MGTDLAPRPPVREISGDIALIHPDTGEIVPLDAPAEVLVEWVDRLKEWVKVAQLGRKVAESGILAHLDGEALWTQTIGGYKVSAPSPEQKYEWDKDLLRDTLDELRGEGLVADDAADRALEPFTDYKVRPAGINALRKLSPAIAGRLDACRVPVDKPRTVTIKPRGDA